MASSDQASSNPRGNRDRVAADNGNARSAPFISVAALRIYERHSLLIPISQEVEQRIN